MLEFKSFKQSQTHTLAVTFTVTRGPRQGWKLELPEVWGEPRSKTPIFQDTRFTLSKGLL